MAWRAQYRLGPAGRHSYATKGSIKLNKIQVRSGGPAFQLAHHDLFFVAPTASPPVSSLVVSGARSRHVVVPSVSCAAKPHAAWLRKCASLCWAPPAVWCPLGFFAAHTGVEINKAIVRQVRTDLTAMLRVCLMSKMAASFLSLASWNSRPFRPNTISWYQPAKGWCVLQQF
jgi:hypothetical protein